ncbi:AMP-binding protein [Amycolatopsis acidiphila]|nr:AMP-binding protein [Amycolatopsis acidiphila]UIJ61132.1 AMP-binding protein [Amycolatopsis acidiphila]GHG86526.1 ATP-dependent acyl-CoA ligase [Amycolatopsis acidiphila]
MSAQAERSPERRFIFFEGRWLTYGDVVTRADAVAGGLSKVGVAKGDRVAFLAGNSPDYFVAFLAVVRLGALFVPIIDGSKAPEIEYVFTHSGSTFLVTDATQLAELSGANAELLGGFRRVFLLPDPDTGYQRAPASADGPQCLTLDELAHLDGPRPDVVVSGDDDLGIFYTSGTTGKPKGAVLPHRGFAAAGRLMAEQLQYREDDVVLCVLPLFHVGGLHYCVAPAIAARSGVMLQRKFSVTRFWRDVDESGATGGLLMPAHMAMLLTPPPAPDDRSHPLKLVCSHYRDTKFSGRFGVDIATTWALSEGSGIGTFTRRLYDRYEEKLVGWPLGDGKLKIVDASGEELPPDSVGEICIQHDSLMRGYWRDPEQTTLTLRDGWLHTLDAGRLDSEGRLFFEGRVKNMIKRSGENVAAEEVQNVITSHPATVECAVIGVPDPIRTEEVKAFVVRTAGSELEPEEIVRWCEERLSSFKVPRYIHFVGQLPKSTTGKVQLFKLRALPDQTACWDRLSVDGARH